MDFEYGIIGGGPAGYTAGMLLAQKGHSVVIFEKEQLGGTCLNKGCIPTKSMIHSSELYKTTINAENIGLNIEIKDFDFNKILEKRNKTVERIRKSLELAVKNSGAKTIYANAEIKDKNTILANGEEYKVSQIIYACGAKPRQIKGLEFDGEFILSSDDVLKLEKLPKSVLIIGSGAIGIEWARIFSNFGVDVSIVELAEHLVPLADIDVSKRIERIFKQNKIKFYLNNAVEKIVDKKVILKSGDEIQPDIILSAVGRVPIKPDYNEDIVVLGDSKGEIQLAHYAIHQAKQFALGIECDSNLVPSVIYGEPEIAWVGLREQDCGDDCKGINIPISALGKSWCDDSTDGFIKIITKDNLIVGAHIVSKEASALIHELLIAIQNKLTISDLKKVCFAHPTYSEGIFEILLRT
jgi:dihydrolipoamide dehydrogenase